MVQLSIINPHTIFTLFARLKFFYGKCPFISDFYKKLEEAPQEKRVVVASSCFRTLKLGKTAFTSQTCFTGSI